ncbi:MAG: sulfate transporter CysZ [Gammaproteobacteria bacterium]|jgi:CysZ protein|nr:sulfate transporter CysZ [Gammaproteobacteria bacterium]
MSGLLTGIGYFFRGITMLFQPGLRRFVVIPLLANISVFVLIAGSLYQLMSGLYLDVTGEITGTFSFLTWIVTPIIWLLGTLLSGYLSIFIVLFLTSPFHGLLAEKVEERITGEALQNESSVVQVALSVPRGFLRELQKLLHYLPMAVLVLIISVIPGVNIVAPFLWIILGAWMMSLQFIDYPMDNHRLPFKEVREACGARRSTSIGFGGIVAFLSGVPILNLALIPAAVAGATLLWCEELRHLR